MKKYSVRTEKVMYGNFWAIKRTYSYDGKMIGEIIKNPHTDKYEVLASDFVNLKYVRTETNTFSQALKIIKGYLNDIKIKQNLNERIKLNWKTDIGM